jgi:REP element-mobilizing transposase RayT
MTYREFYQRHLPHWQPGGAPLFITTRLAGSLPANVVAQLKAEHMAQVKAHSSNGTEQDYLNWRYQTDKISFGRWDAALDEHAQNRKWLAVPAVREIVSKALHYRNGKVYELIAFCIMPNHIHILFTPLQKDGAYIPLEKIMQSLKRHTARQANKTLNRQGAFWQAESYDHVVRDLAEFARIIKYIIYNPVQAGLVENWHEWPGTYCRTDWQSVLLM